VKLSKLILFIIGAGLLSANVYADALPLTDTQVQKLRHLFPVDTDSPHIIWKGDPILIQLPLNQEKRIVFPAHITFDAKSALTTDQLRIINNDKSLYLTALKPINDTRVYVTLQDTNEVVLVDLTTSDKASNITTYIDIAQNNTNQPIVTNSINNPTANDKNDTNPATDNDTYVTLTRYAWQQLYAPERLIDHSQAITRAPMHTDNFVSTLVYGDKVYAHPAASWQYNNKYITAVELRNKYPHPTAINIGRDLCGDWQAATLYPRSQLKPAGDKAGDSTVLLLISDKPFGDSMGVCDAHA